jgi:hypothetical protein
VPPELHRPPRPDTAPRAARFPRMRHALLLLATLLLGYAAHGWHHLADPDCDSGRGPNGHACVACSALHGSVVLDDCAVDPAPVHVEGQRAFTPPRHHALAADLRGTASPRAPPAA